VHDALGLLPVSGELSGLVHVLHAAFVFFKSNTGLPLNQNGIQ
jgi:hypothetical protein